MQQSETATATAIDADAFPTTRWSAIFGGWLVATGIALLMYIAGLALGFAAFDPDNAETTAKGISIGAAVWMILTWAVAMFLGGMFASWFDGRPDQTVGTLHGVTVWALSLVATGLLLTLASAVLVHGGVTGAAVGASMGGSQGAGRGSLGGPLDAATMALQAQLTQRVAQASARSAASAPPAATAPSTITSDSTGATAQPAAGSVSPADVRRAAGELDRQSMALVASALIRGQADQAKAILAASTTLSQAEIDQTLQSLSAQIEKYKTDLRAAADAAARYTSMAMGILFLSALLSLVLAGIGGWLGAGHIHRVHHLRRYETKRRATI